MSLRMMVPGRAGLMILLTLAGVFPVHAGLEGRWRLVEQRGATGPDGPARSSPPARLEILREGAGLTCRVSTAEEPARVFPWPVFLKGHESLPVAIEERILDERTGRLRARYTVDLPEGDPQALRVVEDYALSEDRRSLDGTVRLTLVERGTERGTWVIRRQFVREP